MSENVDKVKIAQALGVLNEAYNVIKIESAKVEDEKTDWTQEKFTWQVVVSVGILFFLFDWLCNEISWLQRYSIISYVFTLITSLLVGFKFFDYATPQINFFSNWKGNQYEVIAKALVLSTIIFVLGLVIYSAANTNVSGATSPQEPLRERIIERQTISQDSSTKTWNQGEPEREQ